jgi:hypothetical protein
MAFCKNKNYSIKFNHKGGFLDFGDGHEMATSYDAFRSPDSDNISEVQDNLPKLPASPTKAVRFDVTVKEISTSKDDRLKNNEQLVDAPTKGGVIKHPKHPSTTHQHEQKHEHQQTRQVTKDLEEWLPRLAFAPFRDLITGSQHGVWSDTKFRLASGSFSTNCKISVIPKTKLSKIPFPKAKETFQRIFIDTIPGSKDHLQVGENFNCYLMIVDQYSRWISIVGMKSYSSESAIQAITKWARGERGLTTLNSIE